MKGMIAKLTKEMQAEQVQVSAISMSLMWGKFKDLVDALQLEMDGNVLVFKVLESNLNQHGSQRT